MASAGGAAAAAEATRVACVAPSGAGAGAAAPVATLGARRGGRPARGGGERRTAEVAGRRLALLRVLGQRPRGDRVERGRDPGDGGRSRRRVVEVGEDRRGHGVAAKRRRAGERRREDAAERVDVGARVGALAAQVLRRHEVHGPHPRAALGQAGVRALHARDAEVAEIDVVAGDEHVRGLDVAVHEPRGVRGVEPVGDLGDDRRGPRGLEAPVAREQRVEVGAGHVADDEEEAAALLAGGVDGDDVGMVDGRGQAGLTLEALAQLGIGGAVGGDELQRDRAPEAQVGRSVDDAHAAATEHAVDPAARELIPGASSATRPF